LGIFYYFGFFAFAGVLNFYFYFLLLQRGQQAAEFPA
jgi:hypothetical protein